MAVIVEKRYGRAALIACMDFRKLLASYNHAAAERNAAGGDPSPLWRPQLLAAVKAVSAAP